MWLTPNRLENPMKKVSLVFVAAASIAALGCGKKGGAGGGGDCDSAVNHMINTMMADQGKDAPPEMKKMMEGMMKSMKTVMTDSCKKDGWSSEAIACIAAAKDEAAGKACESKFTKAQKDGLENALKAAMSKAMGMPDEPKGDEPKADEPPKPEEPKPAEPAAGAGTGSGSAAAPGSGEIK